MTEYTNALINETSPYLLQHAHNPVQWYPWGNEALMLAQQEQKPILLSIGYSACHWCHVMAYESFEDPNTAALMNELFINIKVDREERPDLDKIYQTAHQLIAQRHGGWPLTMFLSPEDQYPFFGGTYFPPQSRYGMPAFTDLLKNIITLYRKSPDKIKEHTQSLATALNKMAETTPSADINPDPLNLARAELAESFDHTQGGFGGAPKFPHLTNIERLLRHYNMTAKQGEADEKGLKMALFSLKKMALGGIYDQLGGGFCRYSVDELWMIPHFEKMLYDNGPFLSVYSQAWQITQDKRDKKLFKRIVLETADWVIREMQSPEGGFYSTLDADSEGEEGKFYVWTKDEVKTLLNEDETLYPLFSAHFGLNHAANFEGNWHLYVSREREDLAKQFNLPLETIDARLNKARQILFKHRQERIHPGCDEKILTSWNALMIKGMAIAGRTFDRPDYIKAAEQSLNFIKNTLWVDKHLLATYKDGKAHLNAYLDDYAFLLDAILNLLQARWCDEDMKFAIELAEILLTDFFDSEQGGFYFTAHNHENLISRPKSFNDDAMPNGNGIAAFALAQLGHLLGEQRYIEATKKTIKASWYSLMQMASAHTTMLFSLEEYLVPPEMIILRGEADNLKIWQTACPSAALCFPIPNNANSLPGLLAEKKAKEEGKTVAYICKGYECQVPIKDLNSLQG
jgi:uncharacterized protein YyaL (SSP411 family)